MQLTVREAARHLGVPEQRLRRWIKERGLPAHRVNEQLRLNAVELWEWATANGIPVSRSLLHEAQRDRPEAPHPPLADLLRAGGIHHDVAGADKAAVLAAIVRLLPLPTDVDRGFLLAVLEAREALGSTGIGDGIAIPHVRNPILLPVREASVTLALLRHPVEFDAVDGKPVHALFAVVSPSVAMHLGILSRLGFALHDDGLRALLGRRAPAEEILARISELEARRSGVHPAVPERRA